MIFSRWTYACRVLSVHDGDTIRAEVLLGFDVAFTTTLRLVGIQAPEVGGPNVSAEEKAAGIAARDFLRTLLDQPDSLLYVRTEKDRAEGRGRYLATLYAERPNGQVVDLNARMVAEGHAIAHTGDGKVPKWIGPRRWRLADGTEVAA